MRTTISLVTLLSVSLSAQPTLDTLLEDFSGHDRKAWGDATYVNYRRFQTSARIVPQ